MPWGRSGKSNNRSLDTVGLQVSTSGEQAAAEQSNRTAPPLSTESFANDNKPQSAPLPPPHQSFSPVGQSQSLSAGVGVPHQSLPQQLAPEAQQQSVQLGYDAKQGKAAQDFADAVSRSHSHRSSQLVNTAPNIPYTPNPVDIPATTYPGYLQTQPDAYAQQPQPPAPAPVESKRSTRRLIKSILGGAPALPRGEDAQHRSSQLFPDSNSGIGRRLSHRTSGVPAIRTGASQVSLEQQYPANWHNQSYTQASPSQVSTLDQSHPGVRRVATDTSESPFSEDGNFQHFRRDTADELLSPERQVGGDRRTPGSASSPHPQFGAPSPASQQGHPQSLGRDIQHNPETASQQSRESDHYTSGPTSATSPPAVTSHPPPRSSSLTPQPPTQPPTQGTEQETKQDMAPQASGPPPIRRSQDEEMRRGHSEPQPGSQQNQRHQQQTQPNLPPSGAPASLQPGLAPGGNYRPGQMDGQDPGRASPQPPEDDKAFKELLTKYKNVKRLYFDGKTQVDQLNGQVEQLQNAIANQRMSQSRTALDDSEYMTRFNRLNGAINNLSFNIRKDWATLPSWLGDFCTQDALKTGKQEMTAVGRAVITRWVVDEIFNHCFHPGLDPTLSRQLKEIEHNIRRFSYTINSREEYDALTTKVVNWRMATLEGLQKELQSPDAAEHRADFTKRVSSNLTAHLFQYLAEPPPAGVDGSASMIVELAVGIASNIPLESRDVAIIYPMPNEPIDTRLMEVEKQPLPVLDARGDADEDPGEDAGEKDAADGKANAGGLKERSKSRAGMAGAAASTISNMLGSASRAGSVASVQPPHLHPDRKGSVAAQSSRANSIANPGSGSGSAQQPPTTPQGPLPGGQLPSEGSNASAGRVRFAGFLAVDVRGRQVLVKAPVWAL